MKGRGQLQGCSCGLSEPGGGKSDARDALEMTMAYSNPKRLLTCYQHNDDVNVNRDTYYYQML